MFRTLRWISFIEKFKYRTCNSIQIRKRRQAFFLGQLLRILKFKIRFLDHEKLRDGIRIPSLETSDSEA